MQVLIVGAGAIGGVIAAHLAEHNVDLTLVAKYPELVELIKSRGIHLQGVEKPRKVVVNAVPKIEDLQGKFDTVFLAMKATDVKEAAKAILPFLKEDSMVVTLQNGIVEDDVGKIVGRSRVIGAVVGWGATMVEPGVIEKTSHGEFIIGMWDLSKNNNHLELVAELLRYCEPVRITDNIYGVLYSKLTANAGINSLGAICGLHLGEMLGNKRNRLLLMGIIAEAVQVAQKLDIQFEKISGVDISRLALTRADSRLNLLKKHMFIRAMGFKFRKVKSSTLQSLERGRPSEIDYLNGYIVKKGESLDVATPINTAIVQLVKEIEKGKRKITPE
ncbi:MAG: ketopantoate reductase family protein, partial [Promethearchaeota archaeon]